MRIDPLGLSGTLTINASGNGGLTSGHAWITYQPDGSKESTSYGTWGNDPDGQGYGLLTDYEKNKNYSADASRSMHIDDQQEKNLNETIEKYKKLGDKAWRLGAPCSSFAREAWQSGTGENLNSNWWFVSNPSTLKNSIIAANGGVPYASATASNGGSSASSGSFGRSSGSSINPLGPSSFGTP